MDNVKTLTAGTTPTLRWRLNGFHSNDLEVAAMTILCTNGKRLTWTLETAQQRGDYIQWLLTQQETMQITEKFKIQLRFRTRTGYVGASPIYDDTLSNILKREVL